MKNPLERVSCARLPAESLAALAGLRRSGGISVISRDDQTWVFWEEGDDGVLRAILPVPGVELFERRGESWHRVGHRLPSFEVPPDGEPVALARAVLPELFSAEFPGGDPPRPIRMNLVRDSRARPTSAALCPLLELVRWADLATSAELGSIQGAISGDFALLVGRSLPHLAGVERYWGRQVLVPIGHEPRPNLPESSLFDALGGTEDVILRLVPEAEGTAVEAIPTAAFGKLTRAGVRLALSGERR
ncbi:hypothetical protein P12x_000747 [Tundrisphaera lichenicola]|uniref:hypothetical protein n=1 Tax=Tundrisphaera lichenicola TaxID=2029860 RepID=UPI003EC0202E